MSEKAPERWRGPETVAEHLETVQARAAGRPEPRYESAAYISYKLDALRSVGLDDEVAEIERAREAEPSLDEMTPEQHLKEIRER